MPSAKSRFDHDAPQLLQQMLAAASPAAALQVALAYLRHLASPEGDYVGQLSVSQGRLVGDMVGHLRQLLSGYSEFLLAEDAAARAGGAAGPADAPAETRSLPKAPALIGIGTAGLVGGLVSSGGLAVLFGIAAGIMATLAAAEMLQRNLAGERPPGAEGAAGSAVATLTSLYQRLLDIVGGFLESLDALVNSAPAAEPAWPAPPPAPTLEDLPSVLRYLQRLGALGHGAMSAPAALDTLLGQDLADLLSEFGLWLDTDVAQHPAHFDRRKAAAAQSLESVQLIRPAVMKGEVVILRGQALEP